MPRENAKTLEFDFHFVYSKAGQYEQANQITLLEPTYDNRDVYRTMRGYMGEAEMGLMKRFSGLDLKPSQPTGEAPAPAEKPAEPDLLEQMRYALGREEYSKFCDYVQKQLTGRRSLAFVGPADTPVNERVAVQDQSWEDIAKQGGMAEIDRVLSAFGSFFVPSASAPKSPEKTLGSTSSLPPPASPPARSRNRTQS